MGVLITILFLFWQVDFLGREHQLNVFNAVTHWK